jgi:hypothetical protein
MKALLIVIVVLYSITDVLAVQISEVTYEGRPHFLIRTKSAEYYLDKAGGGLSRMIDRDGNDWIAFKMQPWNEYPQSAASSYRGLPNLVFGSEDNGAGHPGHDQCYSFKVDAQTILTISKSGNWQWRWMFYKHHAVLRIEKTDPDHRYWFLYEGPVAGRFSPVNQYWGNNLGGPRSDINDYYKGDRIFGNWHWNYFGDISVKRVLFVASVQPDRYLDTFSYLGDSEKGVGSEDGMVVFGFGRHAAAEPQLTDPDNAFIFGFIKKRVRNLSAHEQVQKTIEGLIQDCKKSY